VQLCTAISSVLCMTSC